MEEHPGGGHSGVPEGSVRHHLSSPLAGQQKASDPRSEASSQLSAVSGQQSEERAVSGQQSEIRRTSSQRSAVSSQVMGGRGTSEQRPELGGAKAGRVNINGSQDKAALHAALHTGDCR